MRRGGAGAGMGVRLLLALRRAGSVRELARLGGVSLNAALNFISRMRRVGRFKFVPDYGFFGLVRVAAFSLEGVVPGRLPPGTVAVREFLAAGSRVVAVLGLVPFELRSRFLGELGREMSLDFVVEAREFRTWVPREDLMVFSSPTRFSHVMDRLWEVFEGERARGPPRYVPGTRVPDKVDLKILAGKLAWGPFARPGEILARVSRYTGELAVPSRQVVSYHYRRHVLPGWVCNTYHMYVDARETPFVAAVLRGREAAALARVLVYLPYSGVAYVDDGCAFYLGQVACWALRDFYALASSAEVEFPFGFMVMKFQLKAWVPFLWRFVGERGGRRVWLWPSRAKLRLRSGSRGR